MQVALGGAVIGRIDGTTILGASVGATAVGQIRSENKNVSYIYQLVLISQGLRNLGLTGLEVTGGPSMAVDPGGFNATILSQRDFHSVAAINHLKTTIGGIHSVNGSKNSQVLNISDMSIRIRVNMRIKTAYRIW